MAIRDFSSATLHCIGLPQLGISKAVRVLGASIEHGAAAPVRPPQPAGRTNVQVGRLIYGRMWPSKNDAPPSKRAVKVAGVERAMRLDAKRVACLAS